MYCSAQMGAKVSDDEVKEIFAAADDDSNAKLSFHEFLVFLCVGYLLNKLPEIEGFGAAFTTAVDAFDVFDVANQGVIVLSEVRATLKEIGTPETLVSRMAEMDKDGNGYVVFPEFLMAFCDWVGVDENEDEDEEVPQQVVPKTLTDQGINWANAAGRDMGARQAAQAAAAAAAAAAEAAAVAEAAAAAEEEAAAATAAEAEAVAEAEAETAAEAEAEAEEEATKAGAFEPPIKFRVLHNSTIRKGMEKEDAANGEHPKGAVIEVVQEKKNSLGLTIYKTITPAKGKKNGGWVKLETSKGKLQLERVESETPAAELDDVRSPEPIASFEPPIKFRVVHDSTTRKGPEKNDPANGEHPKGAVIEVDKEKKNSLGQTVYHTITPAKDKKKGGWVKLETSKGKLQLERAESENSMEEEPQPQPEAALEEAVELVDTDGDKSEYRWNGKELVLWSNGEREQSITSITFYKETSVLKDACQMLELPVETCDAVVEELRALCEKVGVAFVVEVTGGPVGPLASGTLAARALAAAQPEAADDSAGGLPPAKGSLDLDSLAGNYTRAIPTAT